MDISHLMVKAQETHFTHFQLFRRTHQHVYNTAFDYFKAVTEKSDFREPYEIALFSSVKVFLEPKFTDIWKYDESRNMFASNYAFNTEMDHLLNFTIRREAPARHYIDYVFISQ